MKKDYEGRPHGMLDMEEAAAHTGLSARQLKRRVAERRVTFYKPGKKVWFRPEDLDQLIAESRVDRQK